MGGKLGWEGRLGWVGEVGGGAERVELLKAGSMSMGGEEGASEVEFGLKKPNHAEEGGWMIVSAEE